MENPAVVLPGALPAILALGRSAQDGGVPQAPLDLINLAVRTVNRCSVCVEAAFAKKPDATHPHLYAAIAWRDMPYFSDAERAALALAEAITRQSEQPDGVTDEIWAEAARHYDERALAAIVVQTAVENVWNRLNSAVRQPADTPWS